MLVRARSKLITDIDSSEQSEANKSALIRLLFKPSDLKIKESAAIWFMAESCFATRYSLGLHVEAQFIVIKYLMVWSTNTNYVLVQCGLRDLAGFLI